MTTTPAELIEDLKRTLGEALLEEQRNENAFEASDRPMNGRAMRARAKAAWDAYDAVVDRLAAALEAAPSRKLIDHEDAYKIADALLDRPNHDPDSDENVVARQLLRQRDALAAQPTQGSGDYVLVPREPTKAMCQAGWHFSSIDYENLASVADIYRAMISAATGDKP